MTLAEMENELHEKRALCRWHGVRGEYEMQNQLASECYELHIRIAQALRQGARLKGTGIARTR